MFDASKWAVDNLLEDFLKKPIKVTIENVSDKYIITGTLQVFKKEKEDHGNRNISKSGKLDNRTKNTRVAKVSTRKNRKTNLRRGR